MSSESEGREACRVNLRPDLGVSDWVKCSLDGDRDSSDRLDLSIDLGRSGRSSSSSSVLPCFFLRMDFGFGSIHSSSSSSRSRSRSSWEPDLLQVLELFRDLRMDFVWSASRSSMLADRLHVRELLREDFFRMDLVPSETPSGLWLPL